MYVWKTKNGCNLLYELFLANIYIRVKFFDLTVVTDILEDIYYYSKIKFLHWLHTFYTHS